MTWLGLVVVAPLAVLAVLRWQPALDAIWDNSPAHFWLVLLAAAIAATLAAPVGLVVGSLFAAASAIESTGATNRRVMARSGVLLAGLVALVVVWLVPHWRSWHRWTRPARGDAAGLAAGVRRDRCRGPRGRRMGLPAPLPGADR